MRKIKRKKSEAVSSEYKVSRDVSEKLEIMKEVKFILLISWIFPFIGVFFLYLAKKKLLEKPKSVLCKILNMNFTVILINFILVSILQTFVFAQASAFIIFFLLGVIVSIFLFGFVSHVIGTFKWLKGENFSYRFSAEFFKPYENIKD